MTKQVYAKRAYSNSLSFRRPSVDFEVVLKHEENRDIRIDDYVLKFDDARGLEFCSRMGVLQIAQLLINDLPCIMNLNDQFSLIYLKGILLLLYSES